jgi:hypothetical protein
MHTFYEPPGAKRLWQIPHWNIFRQLFPDFFFFMTHHYRHQQREISSR